MDNAHRILHTLPVFNLPVCYYYPSCNVVLPVLPGYSRCYRPRIHHGFTATGTRPNMPRYRL